MADLTGLIGPVGDRGHGGQDRRAHLLERCERIDVLANNAGGAFPRRVETVDGHELTFQVNQLGPPILTNLLHELA
jgi:NAD(P)-dependent dehydrogenase (short-subunit alcohol dehydrogenase family)